MPDGKRLAAYCQAFASALVALLTALMNVAPVAAQEFSFSRYTQVSGLRNLGIEQLLVDGNADLWVATDGGIYRYDGTTFTPYDKARGIPADAVLALTASPTGRIFARVDAGLYSGDADHFEPLQSAEGPITADQQTILVAPADDRVLFLKGHQIIQADRSGGPGSLWTTRALFSAARLAAHPELASINGVIEVAGGQLWFGCGMRLCHMDGQKLTVFGANEGVPEAEYGALLEDRHGRIWARSLDRLVALDHGASRFALANPPHVLLANRVRRLTLTLDPMGHVVTRTSQGLARWDGTSWQEFGDAEWPPRPSHHFGAGGSGWQFLAGGERHWPVSLAWV